MSVLRISNPTLRLYPPVLGGEPGAAAGALLRAVQQVRLKKSERSSSRPSARLSDSRGGATRLPSRSGGGRLPQQGRMKRTLRRPVSLLREEAARAGDPPIARVSSASTEVMSSEEENLRRPEHTRQGRGENRASPLKVPSPPASTHPVGLMS